MGIDDPTVDLHPKVRAKLRAPVSTTKPPGYDEERDSSIVVCSPNFIHCLKKQDAYELIERDDSVALAFPLDRVPLGYSMWVMAIAGLCYALHNIMAVVYDAAKRNVDTESLCLQFFDNDLPRLIITFFGWGSAFVMGVSAFGVLRRSSVTLSTAYRFTLFALRYNRRLTIVALITVIAQVTITIVEPDQWDITVITAAVLAIALPLQDIFLLRADREMRYTVGPAHLSLVFAGIRLQLVNVLECKLIPESLIVRLIRACRTTTYMFIYAETLMLVAQHLRPSAWIVPSTVRFYPAYVCRNQPLELLQREAEDEQHQGQAQGSGGKEGKLLQDLASERTVASSSSLVQPITDQSTNGDSAARGDPEAKDWGEGREKACEKESDAASREDATTDTPPPLFTQTDAQSMAQGSPNAPFFLYLSSHYCQIVREDSARARHCRDDPELVAAFPFTPPPKGKVVKLVFLSGALSCLLMACQIVLTGIDASRWWPELFYEPELCYDRYGSYIDIEAVKEGYSDDLKAWIRYREVLVIVSYICFIAPVVLGLATARYRIGGTRNVLTFWKFSLKHNSRIASFAVITAVLVVVYVMAADGRLPTAVTAMGTVIGVCCLPLMDLLFIGGHHSWEMKFCRHFLFYGTILTGIRVLFDLNAVCGPTTVSSRLLSNVLTSAQSLLVSEGILTASHHLRPSQWFAPAFIRFAKERVCCNRYIEETYEERLDYIQFHYDQIYPRPRATGDKVSGNEVGSEDGDSKPKPAKPRPIPVLIPQESFTA